MGTIPADTYREPSTSGRNVLRTPLRRGILSLVLVLFSLGFACLTGEMILRLLGYRGVPLAQISHTYTVNDPLLDWRYIPKSEFQSGSISYKLNNLGIRDVDHAVQRTPGLNKRIIVIGDSVTEGYGVEFDSLFSRLIQSKIGEGVEVINVAAGGLNTPQEIHLFEEKGLPLKPDLVVLNFILNDCDFYSSYEAAKRYDAEKDSKIGMFDIPINPHFKRLLKSSALIYFLSERLGNVIGLITGRIEDDYFIRLWSSDTNRQKIISGFDRLKVLQVQEQFEVVVIIWPLITDYGQYRFKFIHTWLRDEIAKRNFAIIDLLDSFSKIAYRNLQVTAEDNIHPNALGHRIASETFLAWYQSSNNHPSQTFNSDTAGTSRTNAVQKQVVQVESHP